GVREQLAARSVPPDTPCEVYIRHTLVSLQQPSAHARVNVARTMFETDRLPPAWAEALNRMDRTWVPSEFNRETFVRSGVAPGRLAVVPGSLDAGPFALDVEPWPLPGESRSLLAGRRPFRFLSVFDWTLHKGWDALLLAFAEEFGTDPGV